MLTEYKESILRIHDNLSRDVDEIIEIFICPYIFVLSEIAIWVYSQTEVQRINFNGSTHSAMRDHQIAHNLHPTLLINQHIMYFLKNIDDAQLYVNSSGMGRHEITWGNLDKALMQK